MPELKKRWKGGGEMSFSHFDEIYAICCESVKEPEIIRSHNPENIDLFLKKFGKFAEQVSKGEEKELSLV